MQQVGTRSSRTFGFTLIELLVVIAIIGLLASIVLASLNSARKKGRDARRLADLREIATQVEVYNPNTGAAFQGCTGAGVRVSTCTNPDLRQFKDPSGTAVCDGTQTTPCDYAIGKTSIGNGGENYNAWVVCTYVETNAGISGVPTSGGWIHIDQSGSISKNCP